MTTRIGYFPGCSLHATAREYADSTQAVMRALGVELAEIGDWACCGATSAHANHHLLSIALPARTLALAEAQGHSAVLAPCAACYSRLAVARHACAHDAKLHQTVAGILQRPFGNTVRVVNVVELLQERLANIAEQAQKRLGALPVACYYGCLLVRPPEVVAFDDPEQPSSLETLATACGAKPVTWHRRLDCCGGGFSLSRTDSVVRLGRAILDDAREAGARAIIVACPMCQSNLDMRQGAMAQRAGHDFDLPILFVTQLVGLALGLPAEQLGLDRHFVSTQALRGLLAKPALAAEA